MLTLHALSADHYHAILREHPAILVDYYKDQCPACRMLDMALASVASSPVAANVVLMKVKLEILGESFFRALALRQTPTLSVVHSGRETQRLVGYQPPHAIAAALSQSGSDRTFTSE